MSDKANHERVEAPLCASSSRPFALLAFFVALPRDRCTSSTERPISRFTSLSSLSHIDLRSLGTYFHFTVGGLQGVRLVDRGDQTNCSIVMAAGEASLPRGVYRRKDNGRLYFELRIGPEKFYSTKIRTQEEGGLCYDIVKLYSDEDNKATFGTMLGAPDGNRKRRKAPLELNYPDYSLSLVLENFPMDFSVRDNKEEAMEIILKQARAAATSLPKQMQAAAKRAKVQKQADHAVGSQSIGNRIVSQQSVYSASRGAKEHPDLAGPYRGNYFQVFFDVCDHFNLCKLECTSKVNEREELAQKVTDIKEGSGFISFRKSGSDKFHEHMACIKRLVGFDAKFKLLLEACEQEYMSQESECCKLRKILDDHNWKSILESLTDDGNEMTGRQRANENERLPAVLEVCPIKELDSYNVPPEVSAPSGLPGNSLVPDVMPQGEIDVAMLDDDEVQDHSSLLLTHTSCRRENEDERPTEICVNSNDDYLARFFNRDPKETYACDFSSFLDGSIYRPSLPSLQHHSTAPNLYM